MKRGKKIPDAKPDTTAEEEARTAWDDVKTAYDAREALDRRLTRDMTAGRIMAALMGGTNIPNGSWSDGEIEICTTLAVRATDALHRELDGE